ncbi:LOW QUALITY PROTEIN: phospholipase A2 [Xenentodon cancila]
MNVTAPLLLLLFHCYLYVLIDPLLRICRPRTSFPACVVCEATPPKALWQFGKMISCPQPGVNPLKYSDYGCWCGVGGTGTPVDVDKLENEVCAEEQVKVARKPHVFVITFKSVRSFTDSGLSPQLPNNKCQAAVCECDRVAANCFAQAEYKPENKNLDPIHCVN